MARQATTGMGRAGAMARGGRLKKIDALTPEQEAALVAYRDEWLAHGRSCAPADRAATEATLASMYIALGEQPPIFWWCDGPAVGSLVRTLLRANLWANLGDNLWANLRDNLWAIFRAKVWSNLRAIIRANLRANLGANLRANLRDNLWDNLWDNLGDNLGANLGDNLRDNLWANLWANLRDNLRDNLRANLWANLRANLWDNLGANLGSNLRDNLEDNLGDNLYWWLWGQHDAAWPAFCAWPDVALRPMHTDDHRARLAWWLTLSRSCGWWHPYRGVVFVCERPARQAVDGQGRLHHETGPALLCRDGWPVYAWHGVRVSADVIERPDTITPSTIQAEANAEVRRVMIERMGWERWLVASGAQPVHRDRFGDLYQTELNGARIGVAIVTNSTPEPSGERKRYALLVPPEHETAHGAIASTFGLTAAQYAPVVES